ncbi:MAG: alpha/beta hydrolase [Pseudomonadota bacterium]
MSKLERCSFDGSNGNKLAADVGGPADGPPVLLLHGGGQTRHSWGNAQRELIDEGYRVVSLDARGHGESDWVAGGDYGLESQVADVAHVARALGRPALVGASMGGINAAIACGDDADLARALVLVDVTPRLEPEGIDLIERFMGANPDGFASIDAAADAVAAYYPGRSRPASSDGLRKNLRLRENGRWYWHWDPAMFNGGREAKVQAMRERMLAAVEKIRIPTLLVRGGQSDIVSMAGVEELRAYLPHLEFADIAGAGHMIAGDRNDAFNHTVASFLRRHAGAAA